MDKKLLGAILLKKVCDEIDVRKNISMRTHKRYRAIVYYRAMLVVVFREDYNLSYQSIADELRKDHATMINAYKKGKELLSLKYDDAEKIYKDVKSIVSYCEIMMGLSTEEEIAISKRTIDYLDAMMERDKELTRVQKSMIAYGLIIKITDRYCI